MKKVNAILKRFITEREQKSKLDLISELLISGSVEENIELFNKVKANFLHAMEREKNRKEAEINLINRIRPIRQADPAFDLPLKNFEIITPKK